MARGNQRDKARVSRAGRKHLGFDTYPHTGEDSEGSSFAEEEEYCQSHTIYDQPDALPFATSCSMKRLTDVKMGVLAIGHRVPAYERAAGSYNAPETG